MNNTRHTIDETSPILAITGYSGAGKTTLIEALVRRLTADGLAVAVVKHDAHRLQIDQPGKDSDRFFQAGATVIVHNDEQLMQRIHAPAIPSLSTLFAELAKCHDIVLVEGHKTTPWPVKIWLRRDATDAPPIAVGPVLLDLDRTVDRGEVVAKFIAQWLPECRQPSPRHAGILPAFR